MQGIYCHHSCVVWGSNKCLPSAVRFSLSSGCCLLHATEPYQGLLFCIVISLRSIFRCHRIAYVGIVTMINCYKHHWIIKEGGDYVKAIRSLKSVVSMLDHY